MFSFFLDSNNLTDIVNTDDYSSDYIRQSLRMYGDPPGPLVPSTKRLYIRKLNRIIKNNAVYTTDDKRDNNLSGIFKKNFMMYI